VSINSIELTKTKNLINPQEMPLLNIALWGNFGILVIWID